MLQAMDDCTPGGWPQTAHHVCCMQTWWAGWSPLRFTCNNVFVCPWSSGPSRCSSHFSKWPPVANHKSNNNILHCELSDWQDYNHAVILLKSTTVYTVQLCKGMSLLPLLSPNLVGDLVFMCHVNFAKYSGHPTVTSHYVKHGISTWYTAVTLNGLCRYSELYTIPLGLPVIINCLLRILWNTWLWQPFSKMAAVSMNPVAHTPDVNYFHNKNTAK